MYPPRSPRARPRRGTPSRLHCPPGHPRTASCALCRPHTGSRTARLPLCSPRCVGPVGAHCPAQRVHPGVVAYGAHGGTPPVAATCGGAGAGRPPPRGCGGAAVFRETTSFSARDGRAGSRRAQRPHPGATSRPGSLCAPLTASPLSAAPEGGARGAGSSRASRARRGSRAARRCGGGARQRTARTPQCPQRAPGLCARRLRVGHAAPRGSAHPRPPRYRARAAAGHPASAAARTAPRAVTRGARVQRGRAQRRCRSARTQASSRGLYPGAARPPRGVCAHASRGSEPPARATHGRGGARRTRPVTSSQRCARRTPRSTESDARGGASATTRARRRATAHHGTWPRWPRPQPRPPRAHGTWPSTTAPPRASRRGKRTRRTRERHPHAQRGGTLGHTPHSGRGAGGGTPRGSLERTTTAEDRAHSARGLTGRRDASLVGARDALYESHARSRGRGALRTVPWRLFSGPSACFRTPRGLVRRLPRGLPSLGGTLWPSSFFRASGT